MAFLLAVILGTNRVWKLKIPNTAVFEFNINPDRWVSGDSLLNKIDSFEIIKFLDVSHLFTD
jgi:broad specificity phosphatase PhoE